MREGLGVIGRWQVRPARCHCREFWWCCCSRWQSTDHDIVGVVVVVDAAVAAEVGAETRGMGMRGNASTCQGNGEKEARPAKGSRMVEEREHGSLKGGEDADTELRARNPSNVLHPWP